MATAGETVPDSGTATADAAERLANAAGEAADAAGEALGIEAEGQSVHGDARNFWFRALMTVVVVIVCYVATKVIRGERPGERRLRLRAERRAKKKAEKTAPDEIDKLLASVVRRKPGQQIPPGATPIGPGMARGIPPGAGQVAAGAAVGAAARNAAGRGNGVARGPPPLPGVDHRPKLRWDQTNEEVELIIRVDPKVARSDVQVEITTTLLKLNLRGQTVISGHLFKTVDPEGSTWVIDDPGPGHPKEVTITLLKAEPATSREHWWRSPLKGLENRDPPNNAGGRRSPPTQADPEMVRKAIEAIRAKSGGAQGMRLGARSPVIQGTGQATNPSPNAGSTPSASASTSAAIAPAATNSNANAPANAGDGAGAGAGNAAATAQPIGKGGKSGGKKKNRKKK